MKSSTNKIIILLIFSLLLVIASGCEKSDDISDDRSWQDGNTYFLTMSEFENIADKEKCIDFDSIIPNTEIDNVVVWSYENAEDHYMLLYNNKSDGSPYIVIKRIEENITLESEYKSSLLSSDVYNSIEDISIADKASETVLCKISDKDIAFTYYEGKLSEIGFIIDGYSFKVCQFEFANTDAQREFAESFETDDSITAMLDRIKALIPQD